MESRMWQKGKPEAHNESAGIKIQSISCCLMEGLIIDLMVTTFHL